MIRRRLSVALVAAASTTLALVSPVAAQEGVSSLSSTQSTTGDSTPEQGVLPGSLESSSNPSEEAQLGVEIIGAVIAVGLAVTQAAVIMIPLIPGSSDQLRHFLGQIGIQV